MYIAVEFQQYVYEGLIVFFHTLCTYSVRGFLQLEASEACRGLSSML